MNSQSPPNQIPKTAEKRSSHAHWHANLRLMVVLLSVWFLVSYLLSIIFVETVNQFHVGGFPLGFWFAQQGSIFVFIILTLIYAFAMDRIDRRYGVDDRTNRQPPTHSSENVE